MQEVILTIIGAVVTLGGAFFGLVKGGFIQIGKKENGNGHTKERLEEIEGQLNLIMGNHMEHLQGGINKLIDMQEKENVTLALMNQTLLDIKENTKK